MPEPVPKTKIPEFPKNYEKTIGRKYFLNPGPMSNLHYKTREIMPDFFDGIQVSYKKSLAPNKTLITTWILSHTRPSGFNIGGIYNWECKEDRLGSPIIEADINPTTLATNLSVLYYPMPSLKFETKLQNLVNHNLNLISDNTVSIEYTGLDSTTTLSSYNPSRDSGRITISYLRSVTENFALGSELLFEWMNREAIARTALAARYNLYKSTIAATVSLEALDISYWRKIHKSIQMGTTLAFNRKNHKAIGSICYQWNFKDVVVRGSIDSDWSVGASYERLLTSVPVFFGFSILFSIPSNRFAMGLKFDIDPSVHCWDSRFTCQEKNS